MDRYRKIGPVWLAHGIKPSHAAVFLLAALLGICLTTCISTITPYVLAVNLGLPNDQQGQVSGLALFAGECVLLISSSFIGAYSDRIGRRGVFVGGIMLLACGYVLFAYVDDVTTLVAARMFLFISSIGGLVFERISPVATFVLIAAANALLLVAALIIARRPVVTVSVSSD